MNVLVIAAHPDDEVLGVGGTIARHVAKKDRVTVLILTEAAGYTDLEARRRKAAQVHNILKARSIHLRFPTTRLDTLPLREVAKAIAQTVLRVRPESSTRTMAEMSTRTTA